MNAFNLEERLKNIRRFYTILNELEQEVGGKRTLGQCDGKKKWNWPVRGIYFFYEPGEERSTSGLGSRVVRVGTHALIYGGKRKLWDRLRAHKGVVGGEYPGGGDHRSSVFRLHVGTALIAKEGFSVPAKENWGIGNSASDTIKRAEYPIEQAVSQHIRKKPFLWLEVDDPPGPESQRKYIERNAIALLSNYRLPDLPIDPPSDNWLGKDAQNEDVQRSGLWNVQYVRECYDSSFLDVMERFIQLL